MIVLTNYRTFITDVTVGLYLFFGCAFNANSASIDSAINTYTDPEGRTTITKSGSFGEPVEVRDAAGLSTIVTRNDDGNPISIQLPSGAIVNRSYDSQGNRISETDQSLSSTTRFTYDTEYNQVTKVTDAMNGELVITYDTKGSPVKVTSPLGRIQSATFQSNGRLSGVTDTLNNTAVITYNNDQLPIQLSIGSGNDTRTATRNYTIEGYIDTATDPVGMVWDLDYDVMGRVVQAVLPGNRTMSFGYDSGGNLTTITTPGSDSYTLSYNNVGLMVAEQYPTVTGGGSNQLSYAYNLARQITTLTRADGIEINYTYDSAGRTKTVTLPSGSFNYNYNSTTGLLDSITSPDSVTQTFNYSTDLLNQIAWSGELTGSVGYDYDAKGRIVTLTNAGQAITFGYDLDDHLTTAGEQTLNYDSVSGLLTSTTLGSISESFSYNIFAELIRHVVTAGSTTLYDVSYTRDKIGRITQKIEIIENVTTTSDYSYDTSGRLGTVTINNVLTDTYTYDNNNNRLNDEAVYDDQDRITSQSGINYSFSAQGERTQTANGTDITSYQYDAQGTLTGATLPNGTQLEYLLDGLSRRVVKKVNNNKTEAWLYGDAINPVALLDGNNTVLQRYIYSHRHYVPAYIDTGSTIYMIVADHLGSVRLVVNVSDGTIEQRIDYDAWGNITNDTNPNFQPFAFAGGLYDNDTKLTRFGLREYDAASANWTSKDPIGFLGSLNNLYSYVSANPINQTDPIGLSENNGGGGSGSRSGDGFTKFVGYIGTAASLAGPFLPSGAGQIVGAIGMQADIFTTGVTAADPPHDSYSQAKFGSSVVGGLVGAAALVATGGAAAALGIVAGTISLANLSTAPADYVGSNFYGADYHNTQERDAFSPEAYKRLRKANRDAVFYGEKHPFTPRCGGLIMY